MDRRLPTVVLLVAVIVVCCADTARASVVDPVNGPLVR